MRPGGIVVIAGQRYSARSNGELIEEGTAVLITGGDNHGFTVQVAEQVKLRQTLPGFGQAVYANFGSSKKAQALEEEEKMRQWLVARNRAIRRIGPTVGVVFAAASLALLWQELFSSLSTATAGFYVAGIVGIAAVCGFFLLRAVDSFLRDIDFVLYRFSLPTVCLSFFGFAAGAIWGIPRSGVAIGLLWALAGSLLCGLPLPAVTALVTVGGTSEGEFSEPPQPQVK